MTGRTRLLPISHRALALAVALFLTLLLTLLVPAAVPASPEGQLTWAVHTTLVPAWLDPGRFSSVPAA